MPNNRSRSPAPVTGHVVKSASESPVLVRPEDSCVFVIFGASGDLTGRKLIPALYNLHCQNLLPPGFAVLGYAITEWNETEFRSEMRKWVSKSDEVAAFSAPKWSTFEPKLHYLFGDFEHADGYKKLAERLPVLDQESGCSGNRLYYLATSPDFFGVIVRNLEKYQLIDHTASGPGWKRVVIEKPFGHDLASAQQLNRSIHHVIHENQIYRIDHYLGKETVQNIIAFRFANSIIEPIWNRYYIDHVQITAAESLGVEHRGKYYDQAGCLRDMFQNHLFQLLSLVAMEPPVRCDGQSLRDHKADVLKAIIPIDPMQLGDVAIRGQYGPGNVDGEDAPGYRQELERDKISTNSGTETFAALKLLIDNWRWADVPFYIRSGKRLPKKLTEIVIQFKRVPHMFFQLSPEDEIEPNMLTIRIQPNEGISLKLAAKAPGPEMRINQVHMDFSYGVEFGDKPATAYETLLLDAMKGDATLFNRADAVELAWEVLEPILDTWEATKQFARFPNYAAGTWGPPEAEALLARDGRAWKNE